MRKLLSWMVFALVVAGASFVLRGVSVVIVDGQSMEPTYYNNDLVLAYERDSYGIGDVIVYDANVAGQFNVVHRVVDEVDDGFTTQGDNVPEPDFWIAAHDRIYGSVFLHIPRGGAIVSFLRQPAAMIAFVSAWLVFAWLGRRERRDDAEDGSDDAPLSRTERREQQREKRTTASLLSAAVVLGGASGLYVAHAATLRVDGGVLQAFSFGASDLPERPPLEDEDAASSLIERQTTSDVDRMPETEGGEAASDADHIGRDASDPGTGGPGTATDSDASPGDDEPDEPPSDGPAPSLHAPDDPDDGSDVDAPAEEAMYAGTEP